MKQRPKFRASELNQNDKDKYKNNEDTEMTIKSSNDIQIPTTDIEVKEGDTLQALSLRYHCPVAELKRLNNLHRDNEIFARRKIKVPYRAFSMAAVHKSGDNSPEIDLLKNSIDVNILKQKLSTVSSIPSTSNDIKNGNVVVDNLIDISDTKEANFNQIIFNTTITNKVETEDKDDEILSDEEIQLLPNNIEITEQIASSEFSCNGADWGLSWPILLTVILIIAFVGPLIYIFYIAEHPEKYHHHHNR